MSSSQGLNQHTSRRAKRAPSALLLVACLACLACLACSDRQHPPPPPEAFQPGSSGDAAIDTSRGDGGSGDVADAPEGETEVLDGGSPCAAYCRCMAATCASEDSYPFPSESACLSWCSKRSDAERTCYARFCAEAAATKAATIRTHDCDHATGAFGLAECT